MYLVGRRAGSWECPHPLGSLTSLGVPERGCVCVRHKSHPYLGVLPGGDQTVLQIHLRYLVLINLPEGGCTG